MNKNNQLHFQNDGAPYSLQFDDIYFDTNEGFQQSQVVFINGNQIPQRLLTSKEKITIGETGFGTGLNFLLTVKTYLQLLELHGDKLTTKIEFISVEKYPLSKSELEKSLSVFPELADIADIFIAEYPEQVSSDIQLSFFSGKISLKVLIGDATSRFSQINQGDLIDAWYLDGFSPAKNPDMWQLALYKQMARLSKPQATLATFTVSGKVRRELIEAGFRIQKTKAQIKKKEILTGKLQQSRLSNHGYKRRPVIKKPQQVAIIGGGIASACAAYALTQQGIKVTLYCKDDNVAQSASSNNIGALYPLLHLVQDDISLFYQQAFEYALNHYQLLLKNGYEFEHEFSGLLELSFNEKLKSRQQEFAKHNPWPKDLIYSVDQQQASELANIALDAGGLFMPRAGWVSPRSVVQNLLKAAKDSGRFKLKTQTEVLSVKQLGDLSWSLATQAKTFTTDALIICAGAEGLGYDFLKQLPLYPVKGQVTSMHATPESRELRCVICHKGYLTPANHDIHCIGATFDKDELNHQASTTADDYNLKMLKQSMPSTDFWQASDIHSSKARVRCMTPDHMPVVGPMPDTNKHIHQYPHLAKDKHWRYSAPAPCIDNLYVLTGLGARGLVTAPLLADILAADLAGIPYPVDDELLFNLAPNRFVIRDIIKRKIDNYTND